MKDVKEYKVSFGFRIESNSTEIDTHIRTRMQQLTIPLTTTIIGAILQPIFKTILQYGFAK
jgi:hypothetical protein